MMRKASFIAARALPLALGMALLSGCVSFGGKPPAMLLTLSSAASVPAGEARSTASMPPITISTPVAVGAVATMRVPVQSGDVAIAYVAKAQWVEPPARLFGRVLADTVAARTGRVVLGTGQFRADPGVQLSGELRAFGVDSGGPAAVVVYDATLLRTRDGAVERRRFAARVPVPQVEAAAVAAALNSAANKVAAEVADWVGK